MIITEKETPLVAEPRRGEAYAEAAVNLLCLNLIVKNESKIILRMLNSVVPYINSYCICDTGSTDNTIEIIEKFFLNRPHITGKIIREPFVDFAYNRTFALRAANLMNSKYILLLDADMVLDISDPREFRNTLMGVSGVPGDAFYIFQGTPGFYYKNVRIVKNNPDYFYWGTTHEYMKTTEGTRYVLIPQNVAFVTDLGDGGAKSDKFERDIRLLLKGLDENPNNDRYTFYLANSYRDNGQTEKAIETFKKRIEIGGWIEEVWHSAYSIGKCYKKLGNMTEAVHWWLDAYQRYPNRIENLYEIVNYYRTVGQNNLAFAFYKMADAERKRHTTTDYLFLQKDIYDYKLDYELSIIGYYCNPDKYNLVDVSMKVLNHPHSEEYIWKNVLSNYKFYSTRLADYAVTSPPVLGVDGGLIALLKTVGMSLGIHSSFFSSTPSLCFLSSFDEKYIPDIIANVRFVDYYIKPDGGYKNHGKIQTKNVIAQLRFFPDTGKGTDQSVGGKWKIINEFILQYDTQYDDLYVGLEDIRICYFPPLNGEPPNSRVRFSCNRGLGNNKIVIETGEIDLDKQKTVNSQFTKTPGEQKPTEKNWVLLPPGYGNKMIYGWSPITIGDISPENGMFIKTHEIKTPHFFRHLRGSTNGIFIGKNRNEIWFITHCVSHENQPKRFYYHCFVVLDATTFEVLRYTPPMTFEKQNVEYTLGFIYFENTSQFLIGYSAMDKRTEYMYVPKSSIDKLFIT